MRWPNWQHRHQFNDYYINRFAPEEGGVFYIFVENPDYDTCTDILYVGYSDNIKGALLKLYEGSDRCVHANLKDGIRLMFSYMKAANPERFFNQVMTSYYSRCNDHPLCMRGK